MTLHLKITSDRSKPGRPAQYGYLWHYGHFIHDFLMPLNDVFFDRGIDPTGATLYVQNIPRQAIGPFAPIVAQVFGVTLEEIDPERFDALDHEHLILKAYRTGPFETRTLDNVLTTARLRFDMPSAETAQDVILIERGVQQHGFEAHGDLKPHETTVGKTRRHIENHADLKALLQARYWDRFHNLVLEDMPFADQVRHFAQAQIVIGQHGAGLNNIIWMQAARAGVVEVGLPKVDTFVNLCAAKGYARASIESETDGPTKVSLDGLTRALDGLETTFAEAPSP